MNPHADAVAETTRELGMKGGGQPLGVGRRLAAYRTRFRRSPDPFAILRGIDRDGYADDVSEVVDKSSTYFNPRRRSEAMMRHGAPCVVPGTTVLVEAASGLG